MKKDVVCMQILTSSSCFFAAQTLAGMLLHDSSAPTKLNLPEDRFKKIIIIYLFKFIKEVRKFIFELSSLFGSEGAFSFGWRINYRCD